MKPLIEQVPLEARFWILPTLRVVSDGEFESVWIVKFNNKTLRIFCSEPLAIALCEIDPENYPLTKFPPIYPRR